MDTLDSFRELGISDRILHALAAKGFTEPSPIQKLTIPLLLKEQKDVIGQAQTGTGKTAAFGIPILETLGEESGHSPRALVIVPTRELCIQVSGELDSLKGESKLRIAPFYGGQYIGIQLGILRSGVDVVVGTPGRIIDLIERGRVTLDDIRYAVLDEADEMLDMGFIEDIEKILSSVPPEKRMLMFSATMPPEIQRIAETFMKPGYEIVRTAPAVCDTLTRQIYCDVRREDKLDALIRLFDLEGDMYAMVFCRTREDVDDLAESLIARGIQADAIHGEIVQAQRTRVINNFKAKKFRILIATDVAARGIDVNDLTHVINYSVPESPEMYIHRIGRTGRAGKTGTAVTFVTPGERRRFSAIVRSVGKDKIEKTVLPKGIAVAEAKKDRLSGRIQEMTESGEASIYTNFASELMSLAHPAEIIAALLKMNYGSTLDPAAYSEIEVKRESGFAEGGDGLSKLEFSSGKDDGLTVPALLELIYQRTGIRSAELGKIESYPERTLISSNRRCAEKILRSFTEPGDLKVRRIPCAPGRNFHAAPRRFGRNSYAKDGRKEFHRDKNRTGRNGSSFHRKKTMD